MNAPPVSYLQTDSRWGWNDYSAPGERTTIRASGCGPTAMAMVLATWVDSTVNPATECAWALRHGWKCPHSGTYYGYFVARGKSIGLTVRQLNPANIYGMADAQYHQQAKAALDAGNLVIACMGKGTWTRSGHYVLVYGIQNGIVYINDPASTKAARTAGSYAVFTQQVKYYWTIQRPEAQKEEEPDMTKEEVRAIVEEVLAERRSLPEPAWSKQEGHWAKATEDGVVDGTRPEDYAKRCEVIALLGRKGLV